VEVSFKAEIFFLIWFCLLASAAAFAQASDTFTIVRCRHPIYPALIRYSERRRSGSPNVSNLNINWCRLGDIVDNGSSLVQCRMRTTRSACRWRVPYMLAIGNQITTKVPSTRSAVYYNTYYAFSLCWSALVSRQFSLGSADIITGCNIGGRDYL